MILIDNYDSFTYNVVHAFMEFGITLTVFENDKITVKDLEKMNFERIVISPGPGNPSNAGVSLDVIKKFYRTKKILGICLGHQCIAEFFGASVCKLNNPVHGKVSKIFFDPSSKLFKDIPQGFYATRYHSLFVKHDTVQNDLVSIASTQDNVNMAIRHKDFNVYGVQFHPEAILTEYGHTLFRNFINIA